MDYGTECYRRFREQGDESGLAEIIKTYKDGLILYLNGFVNNIRTAEELAEDTFVLLGTKKPRDKGTACFKTRLYTIARNLAIDFLRRHKKRQEVSMELCAELPKEEEDLAELFLKEHQRVCVHRAMRKLKPEYQQVLWLVYFEDFTLADTAAIMKSKLHNTEMVPQFKQRFKDIISPGKNMPLQ